MTTHGADFQQAIIGNLKTPPPAEPDHCGRQPAPISLEGYWLIVRASFELSSAVATMIITVAIVVIREEALARGAICGRIALKRDGP
jgi:hypothetical protein